jgi:hypothetical protein
MKPLGQKSVIVLNTMRDGIPRNFLQVEMESQQTSLIDLMHKLKKGEYIEAMPKKPRELIQYRITAKGYSVLGVVLTGQSALSCRNVMTLPAYIPKAMTPPRGPDSMTAYSIPSRVNNRLVPNIHQG